MNLEKLILKMLTTVDGASGYDLTKRIKEGDASFWVAKHQQMYRVLSIMLNKGYLVSKYVPQEGKPDRIVYSITDEGISALEAYNSKPMKLSADRDELMLHLFCCNDAPSYLKLREEVEVIIKQLVSKRVKINKSLGVIPDCCTHNDLLNYIVKERSIEDIDAKIKSLRFISSAAEILYKNEIK